MEKKNFVTKTYGFIVGTVATISKNEILINYLQGKTKLDGKIITHVFQCDIEPETIDQDLFLMFEKIQNLKITKIVKI